MGNVQKIRQKERFIGSLAYGEDLLQGITDLCIMHGVVLGRVEGIGAVKKACIGFYDQEKKEYGFTTFDEAFEITGLMGNISLKEGKPMAHVHVTLADAKGNVYGGHLALGTEVFACEIIIESFDGARFERGLDSVTGLPLWKR